MQKLVTYTVTDPDAPYPLVAEARFDGDRDCFDDMQLERWRFYQQGLSHEQDIGEGPDSWGI